MGNYKFRFSDMIPNAWFYKLRDMNKKQHETLNPTNKKHSSSSPLSSSPSSLSSSSIPLKQDQPKPHLSEQRKSYYFTRDLAPDSSIKKRLLISDTVDPPRKSSRRRRSIKRNRRPPQPKLVSGCSCGAVWAKPEQDCYPENSPGSSTEIDSVQTEYGSDRGLSCSNSSCNFRAENDIVIDITDEDRKGFKFNQNLAPIITKKNEPTKIERTSTEISERNKYGSLSVKVVKENILTTTTSPVRRFSTSPGVKLRTNSPRIGNLRSQGRRARRSVSESFAVVKSSKDPRRDFRESMVEMIVENNIRASKDLEELLACYLSLNSDEYHDLIVNVFKQIWFDFIHLRLK